MIGQVAKSLNSKGQIAVEYILLVVVAAVVATTLVSTLVSRSEDNPGIIIQAWQSVVNIIGGDKADEPQ